MGGGEKGLVGPQQGLSFCGVALVHTFRLDHAQVSLIYVVHLLGELKLDRASHVLPNLTFLNVCTVWHLRRLNPS